mmetsp:Transcript_14353/g.35856  ORF Transcript_14353/g.35856 Transcript_14353/m.35856 type:complete len:80 (-) Transcript_14353:757-996(-)
MLLAHGPHATLSRMPFVAQRFRMCQECGLGSNDAGVSVWCSSFVCTLLEGGGSTSHCTCPPHNGVKKQILVKAHPCVAD